MYDLMYVRQAHQDRLEDAGVVKYGEYENSPLKTHKGTMRSRVARQIHTLLGR